MKHLTDLLNESLLDTDKNYDNDVLIGMLFSKDIQLRRKAFNSLLLMIESYHPKQYKTTAKMKNSNSYFIEFTYPIKIENGEPTNKILDYVTYIQICHKENSEYKNILINASESMEFGNKISIHQTSWSYTQANYTPSSYCTKLYEVPEELNELFRQIQMKAYKYK